MGWKVLEYAVFRGASAPSAGANGTVSITLPAVPPGQVWRVEGIAIFCPSATTVICLVYDLTPDSGNPPCQGTRQGTLTFDDQNSPITVQGGNALTLVFTGVSEGVVAKARVQYVALTGSGATPTPVAL